MKLTIRDILNRLIWDPHEKIAEYELTFIHRGAPNDVRIISCDLIAAVESSWFTLIGSGGEVLIPYHRVLEIKHTKSGKALWRKEFRGRKNGYRN